MQSRYDFRAAFLFPIIIPNKNSFDHLQNSNSKKMNHAELSFLTHLYVIECLNTGFAFKLTVRYCIRISKIQKKKKSPKILLNTRASESYGDL
ncbi:hypothetical protein LEP1GSC188_5094 [Leptospira weilii serovar Topaz str. LT2116]|uniref:Uncharacterized protein n=1 Tax=Leptospira weilii serovar Topaz str. LT2116 TaxID=1088540 RepID=M3FMB5_9LEPT|nr:hypothetical protein LEP1GSC188_5094 [Leptospira weilii serovar Topaz str. LT2116]